MSHDWLAPLSCAGTWLAAVPIFGFAAKWVLERRTESLRGRLSMLVGFARDSNSRVAAAGGSGQDVPLIRGDDYSREGLQAQNFMLLETADPQPSRHMLHYWVVNVCAGRWSVDNDAATFAGSGEEHRADVEPLASEIKKTRQVVAESDALAGLKSIMNLLSGNPVLLPAGCDATALARLGHDRLVCDSGAEPSFIAQALVSSSPTFPYLPEELARRAEDVMVAVASSASAPGWALSRAAESIEAETTTRAGLIQRGRALVRATGARVSNAASHLFEGSADGVWRDPEGTAKKLLDETRELQERMLAYVDNILDVAWPGGAAICIAGDADSAFDILRSRRLDPPFDTAGSEVPRVGDAVLLVSATEALDSTRGQVAELVEHWGETQSEANKRKTYRYRLVALARVDSVSVDEGLGLAQLAYIPARTIDDEDDGVDLSEMLYSYCEFAKASPSCDAVQTLLSLSRGSAKSWKSKFKQLQQLKDQSSPAAPPLLFPGVRLLPHVQARVTAVFVGDDGGWGWADFSDPKALLGFRLSSLPGGPGVHVLSKITASGTLRMRALRLTDTDLESLWCLMYLKDNRSVVRHMKRRFRHSPGAYDTGDKAKGGRS